MSIRWDSLLVRHTARELDQELTGRRLRAIRLDGRSRDLVLFFRDRTLLWRLHPDRGFPEMREAREPEETDQRLKARVRGVSAPTDERIIVVTLTPERKGPSGAEVIIELMGNQLNAIVAEGEERRIRHVLRRREGRRPAAVGLEYLAPEPTARAGADGRLTLEDWLGLLAPIPPPDRATELVRRIAWTSPLNATAFLEAGAPVADDPRSGLREGYEAWRAAVTSDAAPTPVLFHDERGPQPYPFPLTGRTGTPVESLLAGFAAHARRRADEGDADAALAVSPDLLARLDDAAQQLERRVVRLEAELDGREEPGPLRALGDLILARYSEIPSGAEAIELTDFMGERVTVELDPRLQPHDNASAYYDRAGRSERAAERLPDLIERARAERDRMRAVIAGAMAGEVDADTARRALPRTARRAQRTSAEPAPPYRVFRSSGGLEIRVGRGARHNDDLTFRCSAPNDVWLHARHDAGAHVILRWPGPGNPPARDLEEAGVLAALHSKARTSTSVPVDWTFRKYVRKPRGSAPGSVVPDRVRTVFVRPDPALMESLADRS